VHDLQVFGVTRAPLNADKAESLPAALPNQEEGRLACSNSGIEGLTVPHQATARALEADIVSRLAKFFPEATPVRIPIKLSRSMGNGNGNGNGTGGVGDHESESVFFQDTVIEFGTPREVLFMVTRPLEFADRVLIESNDGSLHAEGSVVAVQYHPERTAIAVRFLKHVPNWIVKS
jgi:hypothetical protein